MLIEKYFTPLREQISNREERLSFLTIKFIWISTLFAIGYFAFSFVTGFILPRYLMIIVSGIFITELFCYKYAFFSLKFTSHLFVIVCWLIIIVLAVGSGGLFSYVLPWLALIPLIALVLLTQTDAWIWSGVCLITVLFYSQFNTIFLPEEWLIESNVLWISSLNIGLLFIILILTYVFGRQQSELIDKIEHQNESLTASRQEIMIQRDTVENQNHQLREARSLIEMQHQSLQVKNDELELEINRRTKDLLEYTQQLEQFAFIASHNLRAPIARIAGLGNLLSLTNNREDEVDIRNKLIKSSGELDEVVKDLNLILEIRKGSMTAASELNVAEEIDLILRNLEKDIQDTGAILKINTGNVETIRTIRPYFDSIFFNLISNAIKYRKPEENPIIQISAEITDDLVCFKISDNGIGIDLEKYRDKLFRLYGRFHTHVDGKGLGLYLVNTQVKVLGGRVEVESEVYKGTVFKIFIKTNL